MQRIVVISFNNKDVTKGLTELVQRYPGKQLVIPVTDNHTFVASAVDVAIKNNSPYTIFFSEMDEFTESITSKAINSTVSSNPIREMLREVTIEDMIAISFDESIEAHMALHSVEDYGLEVWDISGKLEIIEIEQGDSDDLYGTMQDAFSNFIDVFAAYITAGVLESLTKSIDSMIHEDDDLDPFEE